MVVVNVRTVPGEWEPHVGTLVTWPGRSVVWAGYEKAAAKEYASLVRLIAEDEPVFVLQAGDSEQFGSPPDAENIHILEFPTDDAWIRDNGPIFALENGAPIAVDFEFNSWGGRFTPYSRDNAVGRLIACRFRVARDRVPFVLEGGAISVNGQGIAMVVEECVLHRSRNGLQTRGAVERILAESLGVASVIWLPYGLLEDLENTDGHVDNVAVFTGPEEVLVQRVPADNPNWERLEANAQTLLDWQLQSGRELTVRSIRELPYVRLANGSHKPSSFINFALTNNGLILPHV